ncbi:MAG: phage late control D family protein [Shewanella sp.]
MVAVQFKLVINGDDVTANARQYLQSITVVDNLSEQADSLTLVFASRFQRPAYQDKIKIYLGREEPLTYLGLFHVQSTTIRNNKELTINATGVDYQSVLKERRTATYATSLQSALQAIAQRHGLESRIDIAEPATPHFEQNNESDLAFLNRLAKEHNAIFNIKSNTLYFVQDEQQAPSYSIDVAECFTSEITESNTSWYACARATYQDTQLNKVATVEVGQGSPMMIVRGNWLCSEDALEAAKNALERANAAQGFGRASFEGQVMFAGGVISIDGGQYQLKTVTHRLQPAWITEVEFKSVG